MAEKVLLVIMDGWGINPKEGGNAIKAAGTPNLDELNSGHPHTKLDASGRAVGLPEGQIGSSEAGHFHIGAGRIIEQAIVKINDDIKNGDFFKNNVLKEAMNSGRVHLMGLVSDGGVHTYITHLYALLEMAKQNKVNELIIHTFLDGRDTPPKSAKVYVKALENEMRKLGIGKIATVSGRYYAMDRDRRWKRTKKTYDALVLGEGLKSSSALDAIDDAYARGETDEFVKPTVVDPAGVVKDGDSIIFFNFRGDRARQLTRVFVDDEFPYFGRENHPKVCFTCMTQYDRAIDAPVAYPAIYPTNTLAEVVSKAGLKQFHAAETEKYAHVTYFFNGKREDPSPGEDRVLINSPKVATYDLQPEMSAYPVKDAVLRALKSGKYHFIVVNFANGDMVGHTGIWGAAVKAAGVVDECVGDVVREARKQDFHCIVTADHGNIEQMIYYDTGKPHTAHTTNPVPCTIVSDKARKLRKAGGLTDVAPTVLELMGISKPKEMTGKSLISE
jgi:2,3-bisphosphoglycerate-independent phosphoglycerate mutase